MRHMATRNDIGVVIHGFPQGPVENAVGSIGACIPDQGMSYLLV